MNKTVPTFHPALRLLTRMEIRAAFRSLHRALATPSGIVGGVIVAFYAVFFLTDFQTPKGNVPPETIADFAGYLLFLGCTGSLINGLMRNAPLYPRGDIDWILPGPFLGRDILLRRLIRQIIVWFPITFLASAYVSQNALMMCRNTGLISLITMAVLMSRFLWDAVFRSVGTRLRRRIAVASVGILLFFATLGIDAALPEHWALGSHPQVLSLFRLGMFPFRWVYFSSTAQDWRTAILFAVGIVMINILLFWRLYRDIDFEAERPALFYVTQPQSADLASVYIPRGRFRIRLTITVFQYFHGIGPLVWCSFQDYLRKWPLITYISCGVLLSIGAFAWVMMLETSQTQLMVFAHMPIGLYRLFFYGAGAAMLSQTGRINSRIMESVLGPLPLEPWKVVLGHAVVPTTIVSALMTAAVALETAIYLHFQPHGPYTASLAFGFLPMPLISFFWILITMWFQLRFPYEGDPRSIQGFLRGFAIAILAFVAIGSFVFFAASACRLGWHVSPGNTVRTFLVEYAFLTGATALLSAGAFALTTKAFKSFDVSKAGAGHTGNASLQKAA